jgi:hypothetical protein
MVGFVEQSLAENEAERLEEHFAACAGCRRLLFEYADAFVEARTRIPDQAEHADPREEPDEGSRIGRYVLLRRLGAGAMGVVFLAHDPSMERQVALKLVAASGTGDSSSPARSRLLREARALARLTHPNVVAAYDVGTHEGRVFVAMEYVEGITLDRWLATPRSFGERLNVMLQAGKGIAAAHAVGLVHRDLKPANIIVGDDGRVRVLDFGLARVEHAPGEEGMVDAPQVIALEATATRTGTIMGTPRYMAPEQYRGGRADSRSDQFSFAVTAFETFYGEKPFAAETFAELKAAVAAGRITSPGQGSGVPRRAHQALLRALSSDRERRFAKLEELLVELSRPAGARRSLALVAFGVVAIAAAVALLAGRDHPVRLVSALRPAAPEADLAPRSQPSVPPRAQATAPAARSGAHDPPGATSARTSPRRAAAPPGARGRAQDDGLDDRH